MTDLWERRRRKEGQQGPSQNPYGPSACSLALRWCHLRCERQARAWQCGLANRRGSNHRHRTAQRQRREPEHNFNDELSKTEREEKKNKIKNENVAGGRHKRDRVRRRQGKTKENRREGRLKFLNLREEKKKKKMVRLSGVIAAAVRGEKDCS